MNRQDGCALLEDSRSAIDRALAFGVEQEDATLAENVGAGEHGGDEIGIGVQDYNANPERQVAHEALAENVASSNGERIYEDISWYHGGNYHRIEVALVVGRDNVR